MSANMTEALQFEYETIIAKVGADAADEEIIAELVRAGEWTERGAREVLQLARKYGKSMLRNALALADAMDIEDGEAGF